VRGLSPEERAQINEALAALDREVRRDQSFRSIVLLMTSLLESANTVIQAGAHT
jgi:hypothetical protein